MVGGNSRRSCGGGALEWGPLVRASQCEVFRKRTPVLRTPYLIQPCRCGKSGVGALSFLMAESASWRILSIEAGETKCRRVDVERLGPAKRKESDCARLFCTYNYITSCRRAAAPGRRFDASHRQWHHALLASNNGRGM